MNPKVPQDVAGGRYRRGYRIPYGDAGAVPPHAVPHAVVRYPSHQPLPPSIDLHGPNVIPTCPDDEYPLRPLAAPGARETQTTTEAPSDPPEAK